MRCIQIYFSDDITHYLPKNIGLKLIALHADPKAFWFGQFTDYILKHNKYINDMIRNAKKELGLPHRYVG